MTKADLIESVANKTDLPKAIAERVVNTVFDDIVACAQGGRQDQHFRVRNIRGFVAEGSYRAESEDRGCYRDCGIQVGEVQGGKESQGFPELTLPVHCGGRGRRVRCGARGGGG